MKKPLPVWFGVIVVAASIGFTSCGGDPTSGPENADGSDKTVSVGDNFFDANVVDVSVGQTVRWVWAGNASHNVTFDVGGRASATQTTGDYSRAFTTEGTYSYHCTIHGAAVMAGQVKARSGTGEGTGETGIY